MGSTSGILSHRRLLLLSMHNGMEIVEWYTLENTCCKLKVLVAQLCLTLCDPMDCSPPGSSVHGDSPGKNTRVDCYGLLQGNFPNQGSNPGLLHCRQILYHLSHQGSQAVSSVQFSSVTQSCPTLCVPMNRSKLGESKIFRAEHI